MADLVDVDLDALAPPTKRVQLGDKVYKLPGDMPLELFMRIQAFTQRVEKGEDEVTLLVELQEEVLGLFQVHQPTMKKLPAMGVLQLLGTLGAVYSGGGSLGEPQAKTTPTPRAKKRTPSKPSARSRAISH